MTRYREKACRLILANSACLTLSLTSKKCTLITSRADRRLLTQSNTHKGFLRDFVSAASFKLADKFKMSIAAPYPLCSVVETTNNVVAMGSTGCPETACQQQLRQPTDKLQTVHGCLEKEE